MQLKSTVKLADLKPQIVLATVIASEVYRKFGQELVITSLDDSFHHPGSLHPSGYAFDLRTSYYMADQIPKVLSALKQALTLDFDVIFENDHFHIEYDPK